MNPEKEICIKRLQNNLMAIRRFAGWTTQELGDLIGVTKQTISNLENKNTKMSLTQYIAIRAILDDEIQRQKDNETLQYAVAVLLDDDELTEEEQVELQKKTEFIASAMNDKSQKEMGMKLAFEAIAAAAGGVAVGLASRSPAAGISAWMTAIRFMTEKEKIDSKNKRGK